MSDQLCPHLVDVQDIEPRSLRGCEECLAIGDTWVHLRLCMTCGQVGCCNDSKNKHAAKHAHKSGHPVVRSFEPGEAWLYCYVDDVFLDPD